MDDKAILTALIRFDRPLGELSLQLMTLDPDAAPMATLTRADIIDVLTRYRAGTVDAAAVERWAALVEPRGDLDYEPRHEAAVADALYDLANPDVQGALKDICDDILAMLD